MDTISASAQSTLNSSGNPQLQQHHGEEDEWALVDNQAEIVASVTTAREHGEAVEESVRAATYATKADDENAIPEGYLRIRLRIGEQIRPAWFKATQIVDDFMAEFFADALANGKKVRLIYMGMLLITGRSMGEYGIEENGVIHCVITDAPPTPHPQSAQETQLKGLANPVNTLLLITGIFLYGIWTLLYHFPHFFSWKSIVLLGLLSMVHISAAVSRLSS